MDLLGIYFDVAVEFVFNFIQIYHYHAMKESKIIMCLLNTLEPNKET